MTAVTANGWNATASRGLRVPGPLWLWGALATVLAMSITRAITDNDDLTSSGTMSVAIRTARARALTRRSRLVMGSPITSATVIRAGSRAPAPCAR